MAEDGTDADRDARAEIAALEEEIAALQERVEQCRKIALAAKAAIAGGGLALLLLAFGAFGYAPGVLLGGLAAFLGGLALLGTNAGTRRETLLVLRDREERRDDLIGWIDLRLVPP